MGQGEKSDLGILEHLYKRQTFISASALFGFLTVIFVFLRWQSSLPNYGLTGALVGLVQGLCVDISAILLTFMISYLLFSEDKVLTTSELTKILDRIRETIHGAISSPSVDELLLSKRQNRQVLELAKREAWILRETGQTIFSDSLPQLVNILSAGGSLKIVVTEPTSTGGAEIAFRNARGRKAQFESRSATAEDRLKRLYATVPASKQRVEVRYAGFSLPATSIIVDPSAALDPHISPGRAEILYTFPAHMGEDQDRMSIRLDSQGSPKAAKVICNEFLQIFRCSSKVILASSNLEDSADLGLKTMFPRFIDRLDSSGKLPRGTKGFSKIEDADKVFLICFDLDPQDQSKPYKVHYGRADRPARSVNYAQPSKSGDSEKWTVRAEHLIGIQRDLVEAVESGQVIFVTNIGKLALGLPDICEKSFVSEFDLASSSSADRQFWQNHVEADRGTMPISIEGRLTSILNDRRSHLFLHFQNSDAVRGMDLYDLVLSNERCSVVPGGALSGLLFKEVEGSVMAIKHGRGWLRGTGSAAHAAASD